MARVPLALLLLAGSTAAPGMAQFIQYTPPGALATTTETTAQSAKKSAQNTRWNLGKVALDPRFSIRDLGYYENVFATTDETIAVDDFRGTVGAGLAAYLNLGSKSLLSGYVTPEYSWWQDRNELSQLTVNWGAGWFGFFNNLTATANVSLSEQERPLSDEVDAPLQIETERQELRVGLSLTDAVGLVASAVSTETRHSSDIDPLVPGLFATALDRDSETVSAGVTLTVRGWSFGVGLESTEVDLLVDPSGRSNAGDSPFAQIKYGSDRLDLKLTAIDREVEFVNPDLGRQEFTAGSGRVSLVLTPKTTLSVFGARSLAFAALDTESIIIQDRQGASLSTELGSRFELTALAESGESRYRAPGGSARRDDLEVFGAGLLWKLRDDLGLRFHFRDSTWDSNLAEFDRSQKSIGVNLELGSGLFPW